jgi:carboxylesterase
VEVLAHARPFRAAGGPIGVLLVHGFTGAPSSQRPWAEYLNTAGYTVSVPRLPGHGTSWQDMNTTTWPQWLDEVSRAFDELTSDCDQVYVTGLSMGGCLALRLAEERGDDVAGLVLVNPSVASADRRLVIVPLLKHLVRSVDGIASDIKKPGAVENGYDRVPVRALDSLRRLWSVTAGDLGRVTSPLLLFRSRVDHVVDPSSSRLILQRVRSTDVRERVLDDSFHVATLDNDAPTIFAESAAFIAEHATAGAADAL